MFDVNELYELVHGDCIEKMADMPEESVDFSVYSPPFPSVYAFTSSPADVGNSEDLVGEARLHFSFFLRSILRVIKPGRVMCVHCMDIVRQKRSGGDGIFDFRGFLIRLGERAGFIHDYTWTIQKNPQAQAIRTRSRPLQFAGLENDRAQSRGCMPDYLIKFRKPGENKVKIDSEEQVTRNEWIDWAECTWTGIRETDTLNVKGTKDPEDTKHVCPLALPLIRRAVKLFSNPGEVVFSPFAGIGSELYEAILLGRRGVGIELKEGYVRTALKNLANAVLLLRDEKADLFEEIA
jgi:DNA modification methylase